LVLSKATVHDYVILTQRGLLSINLIIIAH
jgi:hypothetical protein